MISAEQTVVVYATARCWECRLPKRPMNDHMQPYRWENISGGWHRGGTGAAPQWPTPNRLHPPASRQAGFDRAHRFYLSGSLLPGGG
jgi:hypothetical protein